MRLRQHGLVDTRTADTGAMLKALGASSLVELLPCPVMLWPFFFCISEMTMWNPLPLKNGLPYAALAGALAWSAGGQDLMEKSEALHPADRWYLQVKKGTKEQGLVFPCQENISGQRPVHKAGASCCLCNHRVPRGCRPRKPFQTPDRNTQTHLAGGEKGARSKKLLPRLCWCAVICWLFRQAHAYLPAGAIQPSESPRGEGQDLPPPPHRRLPLPHAL